MFGFEVYNENGVKSFGMEDFTLQRLFYTVLPRQGDVYGPSNAGWRSDWIEYSVPGYDPATCFVIITPQDYAGYDQPGFDNGYPFTPVFKEVGLGRIGIVTYCNYSGYNFSGRQFFNWRVNTIQSTIEVVKVL